MTVQHNSTQFLSNLKSFHTRHFPFHWLSLNGPRVKTRFKAVPPYPHYNIFAQWPKREATETWRNIFKTILTRWPCSDNQWRGRCSSVIYGTTPQRTLYLFRNMNFEGMMMMVMMMMVMMMMMMPKFAKNGQICPECPDLARMPRFAQIAHIYPKCPALLKCPECPDLPKMPRIA